MGDGVLVNGLIGIVVDFFIILDVIKWGIYLFEVVIKG